MESFFVARSFYKLLLLGTWFCLLVIMLGAAFRVVENVNLMLEMGGSVTVIGPGVPVQTMPLLVQRLIESVFYCGQISVCVAVLYFAPKAMRRLFPEVTT